MTTVVGFTGTRREPTIPQRLAITTWLDRQDRGVFLHGDCMGCDAFAALRARDLGWHVECYPCTITNMRAFVGGHVIHDVRPPIVRNHVMVDRAHVLLACPGETHEVLRSGTWATIRYARKQGVPTVLVLPDGTIA